jgi:integrase
MVNGYVSKGKAYYYFRGTNILLPGLPWSPEFMAVHSQLMAQHVTGAPVAPELGARRTVAGSVSAALVAYYRSADWNDGLSPSTRHDRRKRLEQYRKDFGDLSLRVIKREWVQKYVSKIAKPNGQRVMAQALGGFFTYCTETCLMRDNVGDDIKRAKMVSKGGFRPWTEADVEQFCAFHPVGSMARLALAFYLNFGVRKSDVIRIGPRDIVGGELTEFQPQKTARRGGLKITIPLLAETREIIAATALTGATSYLVNAYGKPFTVGGFGNWFRERCREAGVRELASHGLRKLCLIRLAELGMSTDEIMAISGHKQRAEVDTYVGNANRAKMARKAIAVSEQASLEARSANKAIPNFGVQLGISGKK